MEKTTIPVNVRIFGKEYQVACPEGEENSLFASAKRVDQEMRKVRESGKIVGTDRIAVMVGLNLAYELLQSQKNTDDGAVDELSKKRMQKLQEKMDSALEVYQGDLFK